MLCHYCRREVDLFAKRCPYCLMNPSPPEGDGDRFGGLMVACLIGGLTCLSLAPVLGWVLLGTAALLLVISVVR